MNVSTLRYETHNDSDIDVNGTSYQGEISETFENLLKVFGTPMGASDDNKVDVDLGQYLDHIRSNHNAEGEQLLISEILNADNFRLFVSSLSFS